MLTDLLLELIYSRINIMYMNVDSIIGSVMYVALGFVPIFAALEVAWRIGAKMGKSGQKLVPSTNNI